MSWHELDELNELDHDELELELELDHDELPTALQLFESVQRPPLPQGALVHSFTSSTQLWPVQPGAHTHLYVLGFTTVLFAFESTQCALFLQGPEAHSSTSAQPFGLPSPVKPALHVHVYVTLALPFTCFVVELHSVSVEQ